MKADISDYVFVHIMMYLYLWFYQKWICEFYLTALKEIKCLYNYTEILKKINLNEFQVHMIREICEIWLISNNEVSLRLLVYLVWRVLSIIKISINILH